METVNFWVDLISNGGVVIAMTAYLIWKDLTFTDKINDLLIEMRETLTFIKQEKQTMITLMDEIRKIDEARSKEYEERKI